MGGLGVCWGVYSATKFALEGITEALRLELAPLGIEVTSVQPGPLRTSTLADIRAKLAAVGEELETWQELSRSSDIVPA